MNVMEFKTLISHSEQVGYGVVTKPELWRMTLNQANALADVVEAYVDDGTTVTINSTMWNAFLNYMQVTK